jgi:hypothetical protein
VACIAELLTDVLPSIELKMSALKVKGKVVVALKITGALEKVKLSA